MPSWNIHTALTEQLLSKSGAAELGVKDSNAFLFGNLLPDLYVGYMVGDVSHTLRYIDTHFADSTHIPVPRADEFWDTYVLPWQNAGGADDVTRGVWVHLLADKCYNERVRAYNAEHNIQNGEGTRIKKQHDFELFGHHLAPHAELVVNDALLRQASCFAQYEVQSEDVRKAVRAHAKHLQKTAEPTKDSAYQLLSPKFIQEIFEAIVEKATRRLMAYTTGVESVSAPPIIERPDYPVGPNPAILLKDDPEAAAAYKTKG